MEAPAHLQYMRFISLKTQKHAASFHLQLIPKFLKEEKQGRVGKSPFCAAVPPRSAQGTVPQAILERADKAELKKPPALASARQLLIPRSLPVICHKEMVPFRPAWTEKHHPEGAGSAQGTAPLTTQPSTRCSLCVFPRLSTRKCPSTFLLFFLNFFSLCSLVLKLNSCLNSVLVPSTFFWFMILLPMSLPACPSPSPFSGP